MTEVRVTDERLRDLRDTSQLRREYDYQGPWTDYIKAIDELLALRAALDKAMPAIQRAASTNLDHAAECESPKCDTHWDYRNLRNLIAVVGQK